MSKRKGNQGDEPAIKAGSEKPKKPTRKTKAKKDAKKVKPLDRLCTDIKEINFDGQIEFTEKDIEKLEPHKNGINVFACFELDGSYRSQECAYLAVPILVNELAKEHNAHVIIIVPYRFRVSLQGMLTDPRVTERMQCIIFGDNSYIVDPKTMKQYQKALKYLGHDSEKKMVEDSEEFKALVNTVASAKPRENGYYEDLMEYWYAGLLYHEKDVIWVDIARIAESMNDKPKETENEGPVRAQVISGPQIMVANFDSIDDVICVSIDVTNVKNVKVENHRRVLSDRERFDAEYYGKSIDFLTTLTPNEEVWYLATEKAKEEDSPGTAIVCLNGNFYVPVETMVNLSTFELEEFMEYFNVTACLTTHHNCICELLTDVGNMQVFTGIRYAKGRHLNWKERIEQEINNYLYYDPDYNPYGDPYDATGLGKPDDDDHEEKAK